MASVFVHRSWLVPASELGLRNVLGDFLGKSRVLTSTRPDGCFALFAGARSARIPSRSTPGFLLPKAGTVQVVPVERGVCRVDVRMWDRLDKPVDARVAHRVRRSCEAILDDLAEDLAACYGELAAA